MINSPDALAQQMTLLTQNMMARFERIENSIPHVNNSVIQLQKDFLNYGRRLSKVANNVSTIDSNIVSISDWMDNVQIKIN